MSTIRYEKLIDISANVTRIWHVYVHDIIWSSSYVSINNFNSKHVYHKTKAYRTIFVIWMLITTCILIQVEYIVAWTDIFTFWNYFKFSQMFKICIFKWIYKWANVCPYLLCKSIFGVLFAWLWTITEELNSFQPSPNGRV